MADGVLPPGHDVVQFEFTPDATGFRGLALPFARKPGPGEARLLVNGKQVGQAHFSVFGDFASSIDEPLDIGRDSGSPVSAATMRRTRTRARVSRVTIDLL